MQRKGLEVGQGVNLAVEIAEEGGAGLSGMQAHYSEGPGKKALQCRLSAKF